METLVALLAAAPAVVFLAVGVVATSFATRHVRMMARATRIAAWAGLVAALLAVAGRILTGPIAIGWPSQAVLGIYFDNLTAAMLLLITTLGLVIAHYSITYLRDHRRQGQFLKWLCFTIGGVSVLVVSCNLIMYTLAWMATSFGLHQLLNYYHDRPGAIWAARNKFLVSRIGDVLLISAVALCWLCFGAVDYTTLFSGAQALIAASPAQIGTMPLLIAALLVPGAMTKSAQFPFHSWLPETMETPTPVSALMHAGIINAGGFLVIRLSPLVCLSSSALALLAVVGMVTAVTASLTMMTQTSVKRALAYSTVAQMGFMLLECGLGAFTIAAVHLIAHSTYKAYAFLNSGSVIDHARRLGVEQPASVGRAQALLLVPASVLIAGLASLIAWSELVSSSQPNLREIVLCIILTLALAQIIFEAMARRSKSIFAFALLGAVAIAGGYTVLALASKQLLTAPVANSSSVTALNALVLSVVALGFTLLLIAYNLLRFMPEAPLARRVYIHAANGFYLDIPAKRVTAKLWAHKMPWP